MQGDRDLDRIVEDCDRGDSQEKEKENEARIPAEAYRSRARDIGAYPSLWRPFTKQLDESSEW